MLIAEKGGRSSVMDTEKYLKLQKNIKEGKSPTDEGPFYHHSWWESYKGSIKGKLGGTVIGGRLGALVGVAVAAALAVFSPAALGANAIAGFLGIVGAFTAAGMVYAVHEFSTIGKMAGATAATQEQADAREAVRFSVLERKIDRLTALVGGEKAVDRTTEVDIKELETYRTTHYAQLEPDPKNRYVFWKIAAIGGAVGALAGAILGTTTLAEHLFDGMLTEGGVLAGFGSPVAASAVALGAVGASFGINRDIFRQIFDKTDLWFKGILSGPSHKILEQKQARLGAEILQDMNGAAQHASKTPDDASKVATAVLSAGHLDYPASSSFHRDRLRAAAEKALLSFDHTRATPQ